MQNSPDMRKRRAVKEKVVGKRYFLPEGVRAVSRRESRKVQHIPQLACMAEEWLRRCLWGEGRGKPKPRAKISTSTVRSSQKTAGRDHMNLFVRLVVFSEGGSMFSAQTLEDIPAVCLLVCCCSSPGAVQTQLQS